MDATPDANVSRREPVSGRDRLTWSALGVVLFAALAIVFGAALAILDAEPSRGLPPSHPLADVVNEAGGYAMVVVAMSVAPLAVLLMLASVAPPTISRRLAVVVAVFIAVSVVIAVGPRRDALFIGVLMTHAILFAVLFRHALIGARWHGVADFVATGLALGLLGIAGSGAGLVGSAALYRAGRKLEGSVLATSASAVPVVAGVPGLMAPEFAIGTAAVVIVFGSAAAIGLVGIARARPRRRSPDGGLGPTLKWIVANYLIANAAALVGWATYGVLLVADGGVPGFSGSALEQVVWHAIGSTIFTISTFGAPVLIGALVVWRYVGRKTGRPRLVAVASTIVVAGVALRLSLPDGTPMVLLGFALPVVAFGVLVRPWPRPTANLR